MMRAVSTFTACAAMLAAPATAAAAPSDAGHVRRAVHQFGACVAGESAAKAADTLGKDFTTHGYRSALKTLSRINTHCARDLGRVRWRGLPFAGAMAEYLIERDQAPLNVGLAKAALAPATRAHSASDEVAICVVRSASDDVAALFSTEVASGEEAAAAEKLELAARLCSKAKPWFKADVESLRAMLATAAFRTLADAAPAVAEKK